jgi:hypothetical protein
MSYPELFIKTADAIIHLQEYNAFESMYTLMLGWGGLANGILYPSGEPISPHRLRRGLFAVVYYSFIIHFLDAAAILARE